MINYFQKQEGEFIRHEALCKRCGMCCGSTGADPCSNLKLDNNGKYYCADYEARLGPQVTVSGKTFTCVPIRDVLKFGVANENCGYARISG